MFLMTTRKNLPYSSITDILCISERQKVLLETRFVENKKIETIPKLPMTREAHLDNCEYISNLYEKVFPLRLILWEQ